jgi:hypothetical protein
MKVKDYKELKVWQKGIEIVDKNHESRMLMRLINSL